MAKFKQMDAIEDAQVWLNVGGTKFRVLATTLLKCSYFTEHVDELYDAIDSNKELYIDRDPTAFRCVHDHLRGVRLRNYQLIEYEEDFRFYGVSTYVKPVVHRVSITWRYLTDDGSDKNGSRFMNIHIIFYHVPEELRRAIVPLIDKDVGANLSKASANKSAYVNDRANESTYLQTLAGLQLLDFEIKHEKYMNKNAGSILLELVKQY